MPVGQVVAILFAIAVLTTLLLLMVSERTAGTPPPVTAGQDGPATVFGGTDD